MRLLETDLEKGSEPGEAPGDMEATIQSGTPEEPTGANDHRVTLGSRRTSLGLGFFFTLSCCFQCDFSKFLTDSLEEKVCDLVQGRG